MLWALRSVEEWQRLRLLARNKNKPLSGAVLRVAKARRTKDGTFLDELVERGLLEVVAPAPPVAPKYRGGAVEPAQYRTTYKLTALGLHAAEHGEHERPDPNPLPVRGAGSKAAVLEAAPAAARVTGRKKSR